MPRTAEQNAMIRQTTYEKIVASAIDLFYEKGFASTTVQEIADVAGLSVGSLYRHFKTKDDIFAAIINMALTGYDEMEVAFAKAPSAKWALEAFVKEVLDDLKHNPMFLKMMMILTQPLFHDVSDEKLVRLRSRSLEMIRLVETLIKRGQAAGEFKAGDATQLAHFFYMNIQGVCLMAHSLKDDVTLPTSEMMMHYLLV